MSQEIERKFLVSNLPDLSNIVPVRYERYYLRINKSVEERIQRTGDRYSYEKKVAIDDLTRETTFREITKTEFIKLKQTASKELLRDSYRLTDDCPRVSVKIYHGDYEGLIRAEVEFADTTSANQYQRSEWMGKEITDTVFGRDSRLLSLDKERFITLLKELVDSSG